MNPAKKNHNIAYFKIESLFGSRDVEIPFNTNFKILIGENGLGKTSILNALYYTLTGKFSMLNDLMFSKIIIGFNNDQVVEIEKKYLAMANVDEKYNTRVEIQARDFINQYVTVEEKKKLLNAITDEVAFREVHMEIASRLVPLGVFSINLIKRTLQAMYTEANLKLEQFRTIILKEVNAIVLYFPTYRRIEEELDRLGATEDIHLSVDTKSLIQFGMSDVNAVLNRLIESIKNSSIAGFSAITGEMLSQYLVGMPVLDTDIEEKIILKTLNIILERVGENISTENKEKIIALVESKDIFKTDTHKYLLNFLSKLIKIYDKQKGTDNVIKLFESLCNSYLNGKKIVYNESKVTINVIQEKNSQPIRLENLSSGEKQIISLFAKILLEHSSNLIVLFDEPELSLSIEWQKKLLPDMLAFNNCNLLVAVTHSPFIFDNELDIYAEDMRRFVTASEEPLQPSQKN